MRGRAGRASFSVPGGKREDGESDLQTLLRETIEELTVAHRGYVLSTGEIVLQGAAADLLRDEELKRAYLGR